MLDLIFAWCIMWRFLIVITACCLVFTVIVIATGVSYQDYLFHVEYSNLTHMVTLPLFYVCLWLSILWTKRCSLLYRRAWQRRQDQESSS